MREDDWTFDPTRKLWMSTNHRPTVRAGGEAFWRRVYLTPFEQVIPAGKRDGRLPEKLRPELPGILRWAVNGCVAWLWGGLDPPQLVLAATAEYQHAEDQIAAFVDECCVVSPNRVARWRDLYGPYREWADSRREFVENAKAFGRKLEERGFLPGTLGHDNVAIRRGIGLLDALRVDASSGTREALHNSVRAVRQEGGGLSREDSDGRAADIRVVGV